MSGWNTTSRRLASNPDLYRAIEAERRTPDQSCPVAAVEFFGLCTRDPGHSGRHMAQGSNFEIWAAWPGDHEPTAADLTDGGV